MVACYLAECGCQLTKDTSWLSDPVGGIVRTLRSNMVMDINSRTSLASYYSSKPLPDIFVTLWTNIDKFNWTLGRFL